MLWYKDPLLIIIISVVFFIDQITKAIVRHNLVLHQSIPRDGPVQITHTFNTGSAFGLFPDQTLFLILASLVGISILLLIYGNNSLPSLPLRLSLGLQLGGALGNLVDRVRMGHVTDFIELGFWPVFNVADASIVVGIIIVGALFLFAGKREQETGPGHDEGRYADGLRPLIAYACPICDSDMYDVPGGWRCFECGVKERVEGREP